MAELSHTHIAVGPLMPTIEMSSLSNNNDHHNYTSIPPANNPNTQVYILISSASYYYIEQNLMLNVTSDSAARYK